MLSLLLDQQISPTVAEQVRAKSREIPILNIYEWRDGTFVGKPDDQILRAAKEEGRTLVTYDRKTIPPILQEWAIAGISHAGVLFVDNRTIASNNIGGLVRALFFEWEQSAGQDWTNRIGFLAPPAREP